MSQFKEESLLELRTVLGAEPRNQQDTLVGLEAILMQSAFGHEYALMNLADSLPYTRRQAVMAELEHHKATYFWAREKFSLLNPVKLAAVEEDLRLQKQVLFADQPQLH